jgi:P-type Cu+ transporter
MSQHTLHGHDHAEHGGGSCCSGHAISAADTVVRDPVCGMTVDPNAGKPSTEYAGHTYHFCSEGCRTKFVQEPEAYLTAIDPVCGMKVDRATAKHFLRHDGEKHYFCSARCKEKFEAAPQDFLGGRPAPKPRPKGAQ